MRIPDLGGFVLKADSEGRVGPSHIGRTHADAANVIARALKPHGGLMFYRGIRLQPSHGLAQPEERSRARRLRQLPRSGRQVRRQRGHPDQVRANRFSGARAGLAVVRRAAKKPTKPSNCRSRRSTRDSSAHLCFWCRCGKRCWISTCTRVIRPTPVKALVAGKTFSIVPPADSSASRTWAWMTTGWAITCRGESVRLRPPGVESRSERARDRRRVDPADIRKRRRRWSKPCAMQLALVAHVRELHRAARRWQTLTDITGNHYGLDVESSERNGWGQWHRADEQGVGMDRTVAAGTGYIGQYRPAVARDVRIAGDLPGRSFAVHAPRAVHVSSCIPGRR